jgi:single-stranded DNA-binding protein
MMRGRLAAKPSLAYSMGGEAVSRFVVVREVGPASCPVDLPFYVRGDLARRCGTNLFEGDLIEVTADLSMRMKQSGRARQRDYGALVNDVRLKQRSAQAEGQASTA